MSGNALRQGKAEAETRSKRREEAAEARGETG